MKRFLLGFILAISIPAFAAVIWPSGVYLETFQNGFKFGTGKILSVLNDVITFDGKRLDDADKDIFFQEDFEGAAVSFTCDANIAAADDTGLMGSDTSKSFTQSTGAQDEVCSSANIPFAGAQEAKLCLVSSGSTNFDLKVYDVTNSTYLGTAPLRGNSNQDCVWFEGESSTANIRYDLVVRIEENADELIIDNVQAEYFPHEAGDIYASSKWESFTPTVSSSFNGISSSSGKWRRVGDSMEIEASFVVTGTPSGSVAYIDLPNGHEIDSAKISSSSQNTLGTLYRVNNTDTWGSNNGIRVLWTDGSNLDRLFVADAPASDGVMAKGNANQFATNDGIIFSARIPIAGWANTKKSVTVKNTTSSDIASENSFSATINNNGTASIATKDFDWIDSVSRVALGDVTINYAGLGLTASPKIDVTLLSTSNVGNRPFIVSLSNTSVTVRMHNPHDGTNADLDFTITLTKQDPDFVKERDRVYTFAVDSLTGNYVRAEGVDSTSYTANTPIPYTEVKDNANAYSSGVYTIQKNNSKVELSGVLSDSGPVDTDIFLYKNGTSYKYLFNGRSTYLTGSREFSYISTRGEFAEGDTLSIRASNGLTLQTAVSFVYLNISEEYGDRGTFVGVFGQPTCFYRVNTLGSVSYTSETGSTSYTQNNIDRQEGSCSDFSSVASDQITLKKGTYNYRIPIGAVDNTAYVDVRLFDGTTTLKEHLDLIYSGAGNAIASNEARGQVTLNTDTTLRIDTRAGNNSGTMYLFDFEFTKVR